MARDRYRASTQRDLARGTRDADHDSFAYLRQIDSKVRREEDVSQLRRLIQRATHPRFTNAVKHYQATLSFLERSEASTLSPAQRERLKNFHKLLDRADRGEVDLDKLPEPKARTAVNRLRPKATSLPPWLSNPKLLPRRSPAPSEET